MPATVALTKGDRDTWVCSSAYIARKQFLQLQQGKEEADSDEDKEEANSDEDEEEADDQENEGEADSVEDKQEAAEVISTLASTSGLQPSPSGFR